MSLGLEPGLEGRAGLRRAERKKGAVPSMGQPEHTRDHDTGDSEPGRSRDTLENQRSTRRRRVGPDCQRLYIPD